MPKFLTKPVLIGAGLLLVAGVALVWFSGSKTQSPDVITGVVVEVRGDQVVIQVEDKPKFGDPVSIFFEIPGFNDLGIAASGSVVEVEGKKVTARISPRDGEVAVGQVAKIGHGAASPATTTAAPVAPSDPAAAAPPSVALSGTTGRWLGLWSVDLPADVLTVATIGQDQSSALQITVAPGGPAQLAGLKMGDIVLRINGTPAASAAQLDALVRQSGADQPFSLEGVRYTDSSSTLTPFSATVSSAVSPGDGAIVEALRNLAESNDPMAAHVLGRKYLHGQGVPQNGAEAARWLTRAMDNGSNMAALELARAHFFSPELNVVAPQVEQWLRKAAEDGFTPAQYDLGYAYHQGRIGGGPNYDEAIEWFKRAADAKNPQAMTMLGTMYEAGHGLPADVELAVIWYQMAADLGDATAKQNLQRLGR